MRLSRPPLFRLLSALASAFAIASCGGDSTGPSQSGSHVTVSPATDSIAIGSSVTLSATVTDANGGTVSGATIFWNTQDPTIATVSSNGAVTALKLGVVRIAASSSGVSGFSTITVIPVGVASVRVSPSSAAIKVGETVHLVGEPLDAGGNPLTDRSVTWSSSNTAVATVDNSGVVTGVSTGAITITATSEGATGTAGIAVGAAVAASITLAPAAVNVTTGQTSQLTPTVKDANGSVISGAPVTWSIENPAVALVSSTGLVTGQNAGNTTLTATSGSVHITINVTVTLPPANAVIVSPSSVSLLVTQRQQLTATVTDAGGHALPNQTVTWSSSNEGVAAVGTTGLVIAVAPGTVTITGTSGAVSGTAMVTVSLVPTRRVVVTPDAVAFTVGDPGVQLVATQLDSAGNTLSNTGRPITWSSSKSSVAPVSGTGFVTGVAAGSATITATATGSGLSGTSTITVAQVPVASVTVTPSLDTLNIGDQDQLTAVTKDGSGNTLTGRSVTWTSSNNAVAVVTSAGLVTAHASGSATITASSEGKTGSSTIVVNPVPVATVTVAPTTTSVVVGSTTTFTATTKDGSGNTLTGRTVVWSSSSTAVATIDPSTGVATGVATGTATITATSEGKTGTATLTVTAVPVASVTVTPSTASADVGATATFTAVTKDGGGNVLTGRAVAWSSANVNIATIDPATGVATGVGPGTVTITATSESKTGTAQLTVTTPAPAPVVTVGVSPSSQNAVAGSAAPQPYVATLKDGSGNTLTGRTITWDTGDHSIATVDNNGNATGVGAGTTTVTATSEGKSGSASISVTPAPVGSVVVSPHLAGVVVGSTTQLSAVVRDVNNNIVTDRLVAWTASNGNATVDSTGLVTGVSIGAVTITATSEGKSDASLVAVTLF